MQSKHLAFQNEETGQQRTLFPRTQAAPHDQTVLEWPVHVIYYVLSIK